MPTSRNIPLPIQREVRQRCGFGCVICGLPLYEYEHMAEWALVKRHVSEEITLLCDQHHREKTGGLLPKAMVEAANANPFNLRKGESKPYNLHFSGHDMSLKMGSNIFTSEISQSQTYSYMSPIMVDGIPLVGFIIQDNHILLTLNAFDRENNKLIRIVNNQLVYNTSAWDVQLVGTTLTVRQSHREILLEIKFSPPNKMEITRGNLYCNGVKISLDGEMMKVNNNSLLMEGCTFKNCQVGLGIGERSQQGAGAIFMNISRYS
ncbi:cell division protein [Hafnia alvei]|nr:cell division protein [Hafnia alvei]